MGRLPPIDRRMFDNLSPPPRGEVGMRSIPGGGRTLAQTLRVHATPAERLLWFSLRLLKKRGYHFRRQAPMQRYVLDFVCHRAKLVIELDGAQHGELDRARHDAKRTAFLHAQGYRVLRFWNDDVLQNCNGVMGAILRELEAPTRSR
jgi:very-short-patch-repair endonuclease